MAYRKVVFVIVEGPSDETALGIVLNRIFDKESVYIHIMHEDITTKRNVNSENIVSKVGNEIKAYAKFNHYKQSDFKEIIHIVDMDGAYLSDDKIIEDISENKLVYCDDGIHTSNKNKVIFRNRQKTDNLLRLRSCGNIWKIPYKIYYMSCNLDHVLYNKRNSSDEEKETDAHNFAKKYRNNTEAFIKYICDSDFSFKGGFKESWNFIECDMHSIERHTNLSVCISECEYRNDKSR